MSVFAPSIRGLRKGKTIGVVLELDLYAEDSFEISFERSTVHALGVAIENRPGYWVHRTRSRDSYTLSAITDLRRKLLDEQTDTTDNRLVPAVLIRGYTFTRNDLERIEGFDHHPF
jgi:hypothetical protein